MWGCDIKFLLLFCCCGNQEKPCYNAVDLAGLVPPCVACVLSIPLCLPEGDEGICMLLGVIQYVLLKAKQGSLCSLNVVHTQMDTLSSRTILCEVMCSSHCSCLIVDIYPAVMDVYLGVVVFLSE